MKLESIRYMLGPLISGYLRNIIGSNAMLFFRELFGEEARHRIQIDCPKVQVGQGNEAWAICSEYLPKGGIVYSLGIGNEIGFDLQLIKDYKVDVFAFDPTPESIKWLSSQEFPKNFHYFKWGVAGYDGLAEFILHAGETQYRMKRISGHGVSLSDNIYNVFRIKTIMEKLKHTSIDLLKINIEGGEYEVINDLASHNLPIKQIILEFHHRFNGIKLSQTKEAVKKLNKMGYKIFHIAENRKEYSFILI